MLEWLKRHAWKACIRQKRIGGSNPPLSAKSDVTICYQRVTSLFRFALINICATLADSFHLSQLADLPIFSNQTTSNHNEQSKTITGQIVVIYLLSTSNHNLWLDDDFSSNVVIYLLSTSNHNNTQITINLQNVVIYLLSTSNHNYGNKNINYHPLSYIYFLHQTTTQGNGLANPYRLSYIYFLHQTTT